MMGSRTSEFSSIKLTTYSLFQKYSALSATCTDTNAQETHDRLSKLAASCYRCRLSLAVQLLVIFFCLQTAHCWRLEFW